MKDISVDMTDAIPKPLVASVRVTGGWRVTAFCYLVRVAAWVLKSRAEFRFGDFTWATIEPEGEEAEADRMLVDNVVDTPSCETVRLPLSRPVTLPGYGSASFSVCSRCGKTVGEWRRPAGMAARITCSCDGGQA